MMRQVVLGIASLVGACALATAATASQLVYTPVNPTFGGNPLNGSFLLSSGQAQGHGVSASGAGPNLSGLDNALSNLSVATPIVITLPSGATGTVPTNP